MTDENKEIISEIEKLSKKLDDVNHKRFFVFSSNPVKFILFNFLAGAFRSLGAIFGTIIIASAFIYLFSQVRFTKPISNWIETNLSQISWEKIIDPQRQKLQ
jgi:hypothetical protein